MESNYTAAREKAREASAVYCIAVTMYRARSIGDDEFLAARETFIKANTEFDVAWAEAEEAENKTKPAANCGGYRITCTGRASRGSARPTDSQAVADLGWRIPA